MVIKLVAPDFGWTSRNCADCLVCVFLVLRCVWNGTVCTLSIVVLHKFISLLIIKPNKVKVAGDAKRVLFIKTAHSNHLVSYFEVVDVNGNLITLLSFKNAITTTMGSFRGIAMCCIHKNRCDLKDQCIVQVHIFQNSPSVARWLMELLGPRY